MRAEKQAVIQKQRKRRTTMRRGSTLGAIAVGIILIVVLIQNTGGHHSAATTTTTTTKAATTTTTTGVPPSTFAPPTTLPLSTAAVAPTCAPAKNTKRVVWFTKAPPDCIGKTSVWDATFDTSLGKFVIKMDAASSYAAVNNFVFLTQWNFYNGIFFQRVVPGFVVQGGDPTGTGSGGPHAFPGYMFTGNFPPDSCKTKATAACYQPGDFVMANSNADSTTTQNASTDSSQFFLVLPGGQKQLNTEPTYTLFGKVTSGMKIVEKIGLLGNAQTGTPTVKVYVLKVTVAQVTA
jgi:cyclophilin family peptidyl-prolyl cis-trans isomerase